MEHWGGYGMDRTWNPFIHYWHDICLAPIDVLGNDGTCLAWLTEAAGAMEQTLSLALTALPKQ